MGDQICFVVDSIVYSTVDDGREAQVGITTPLYHCMQVFVLAGIEPFQIQAWEIDVAAPPGWAVVSFHLENSHA